MFSLDIETSGLSPEKCFITCIGIASELGLKQWSAPAKMFRDNPLAAEKMTLENFLDDLDKGLPDVADKILLTYNGVAFDLPFLSARFERIGRDFPEALESKHVDLFPFVKMLQGRAVGKDEAIRKFSTIYVPKNSSGAYLARIYTNQKATDMEHLEMLQHNAIDCCATLRFAISLKGFDDFEEFIQ